MATIIIAVHNNTGHDISLLPIPGYAAQHEPVTVPAGGDLSLLGPLTEDECIAIQPTLNLLVSDGSLSSTNTTDSDNFWD